MTPDPFGPELTAFALNDPSLSESQKQAIEACLAADPAARQHVEETFFLARHLEQSLCVNVEPVEDSPMGHAVAATLVKTSRKPLLKWCGAAVAAVLLFGIGIGVGKQTLPERTRAAVARNEEDLTRETEGLDSKVETVLDTKAREENVTTEAEVTKGVAIGDPSASATTNRDTLKAMGAPVETPLSGGVKPAPAAQAAWRLPPSLPGVAAA